MHTQAKQLNRELEQMKKARLEESYVRHSKRRREEAARSNKSLYWGYMLALKRHVGHCGVGVRVAFKAKGFVRDVLPG